MGFDFLKETKSMAKRRVGKKHRRGGKGKGKLVPARSHGKKSMRKRGRKRA
jgi:hypothetical protein